MHINFNIIYPSIPSNSQWSLSFLNQQPLCIFLSSHTCYMPHPSHPLDTTILTIFVKQYKSQSSLSRNFLQSPVTLSLLAPSHSIIDQYRSANTTSVPQPTVHYVLLHIFYEEVTNVREYIKRNTSQLCRSLFLHEYQTPTLLPAELSEFWDF